MLNLAVLNLSDISAAYGQESVGMVLAELANRVADTLDIKSCDVTIGSSGVLFQYHGTKLPALLTNASHPILLGDSYAVLALRLGLAAESGAKTDIQRLHEFTSDMRMITEIHMAAALELVEFRLQPIKLIQTTSSKPLYWECLSRIMDGDIPIDLAIAAMERRGVTRFYDRYVVQRVIELLRRTDDVALGCNISALSATNDIWWEPVFDQLLVDPRLASRLVIEITETSQVPDLPHCIAFTRRMQSLGCVIALDDFGKGFHTVDFARAIKPDIIKIDGSFVKIVNKTEADLELIGVLVALGNSLASGVVLEGVENEDDLSFAIKSGAIWAQGYYLCPPVASLEVDFRSG